MRRYIAITMNIIANVPPITDAIITPFKLSLLLEIYYKHFYTLLSYKSTPCDF